MGAGDVKLLAALGAWLGPGPTVWVALFSRIAGGVMGLVVALASRISDPGVRQHLWMFLFWRQEGPKPAPGADAGDASRAPARLRGSGFRRIDGDVMASVNSMTGRLKSERGAELIEFALVLPLLAPDPAWDRRLRLPVPAIRGADQRGARRRADGGASRLRRRRRRRPGCARILVSGGVPTTGCPGATPTNPA